MPNKTASPAPESANTSGIPHGSLSAREWARRFIEDGAYFTNGERLPMSFVEPWFAAALAEAYTEGQKSVTASPSR